MKKGYTTSIRLATNDLSSRIYTMLVFQPLSLKKLAIILYDDEKKYAKIDAYLKTFIRLGYVTQEKNPANEIRERKAAAIESLKFKTMFEESDKITENERLQAQRRINIQPREKFYRANLNLIYDVWKELFENFQKTYELKPKKYNYSISEAIPIVNGTEGIAELLPLDKETIEQNGKIIKKMKFITKDDFSALERVFFKKEFFDELTYNFRSRGIFSYMREKNIRWDALRLFSELFLTFQKQICNNYILSIVKSMKPRTKNDIDGINQGLDSYLRTAKAPLDSELEKISKEDRNNLNNIASIISLIYPEQVSMRDISKKIYGFTENAI